MFCVRNRALSKRSLRLTHIIGFALQNTRALESHISMASLVYRQTTYWKQIESEERKSYQSDNISLGLSPCSYLYTEIPELWQNPCRIKKKQWTTFRGPAARGRVKIGINITRWNPCNVRRTLAVERNTLEIYGPWPKRRFSVLLRLAYQIRGWTLSAAPPPFWNICSVLLANLSIGWGYLRCSDKSGWRHSMTRRSRDYEYQWERRGLFQFLWFW